VGAWTPKQREMKIGLILFFPFFDGKIAEEWVNRDELGMLIELGVLESAKN
jgi:hypothetical protein